MFIGMIFALCCLLSIGGYFFYEKYQLQNAEVMIIEPKQKIALYTGQSYQIQAHAKNSKYEEKLVFKSQNPRVGEMSDNGTVTTLMPGKLTVTVGIDGSKIKKVLQFDVLDHVYKIIKPDVSVIDEKSLLQLNAYDETLHTSASHLQWHSSDESIVRVNEQGVVEGVSAGKAQIQIMSYGQAVDGLEIEVKKKVIPIESLSIKNGESQSLIEGEQLQLDVQVLPEDATLQNLYYSSQDDSIASVDQSGMITAHKSGQVEIYVSSIDKQIRTVFYLNVQAQGYTVNEMMLKKAGIDETSKLMIVAHPDDETLWGGGHLSEGGWFVICLTNGDNKTRSKEFYEAITSLNAKGIILSYPDLTNGKRDSWSSVKNQMLKTLSDIVRYKDWSMITTHNPEGEYGHIHHKMTSAYTTTITKELQKIDQLYYFGTFYGSHYHKPLPSDLESNLSQSAIDQKQKALKLYTSQYKNISSKWSEMIPHEHWRKAI